MTTMTSTFAFLSMPHGWEIFLILLVALLLFGKRLPDVGRSVGRSIVEFKKGIKGIEEEIEAESSRPTPAPKKLDENRTVSQSQHVDTAPPVDAKPNTAH
jgi:sec-independent protein translocase protein TatA